MKKDERPVPAISSKAIEVVWSCDKTRYGEVFRRDDGSYHYRITDLLHEQMYTGEWIYYWSPYNDHVASFFDAPEKAVKAIKDIFGER